MEFARRHIQTMQATICACGRMMRGVLIPMVFQAAMESMQQKHSLTVDEIAQK